MNANEVDEKALDMVLSDAQQLNALNRVSAFIVHDVKTTSAQLSLLLENAQRHKGNPAFIEDVLAWDRAIEIFVQ